MFAAANVATNMVFTALDAPQSGKIVATYATKLDQ